MKNTKRLCSVTDCTNAHQAKGFCKNHYRKFRLYGDPLGQGVLGRPMEDAMRRFHSMYRIDPSGCWIWTAGISPTTGSANFWYEGRTVSAHKFSYEKLVAKVAPGWHLDHLCRVRHCVNPAHLEPVLQQVNNARGYSPFAINGRKTHCVRGHEFTPENTYRPPKRRDQRDCKECRRMRSAYLRDQAEAS